MARVILLKDVAKVGQKGDIKEVKDGFFRHFLLPRKLADIATSDRLKKHEKELEVKKEEKARTATESSGEFKRLGDTKLVFTAKTTKKGGLYKAISREAIAKKLAENEFRTIKDEWIKIKTPLKEVGEHEVEVEGSSGDKVKLNITIKKE